MLEVKVCGLTDAAAVEAAATGGARWLGFVFYPPSPRALSPALAVPLAALRSRCGADFKLVVPGIRPAGSGLGDQKRTLGPAAAIAAGADWLVVGRPITAAPDPRSAAATIAAEIAAARAA